MHREISWRIHSTRSRAQDLRGATGFLLAALAVGAVLLLLELI